MLRGSVVLPLAAGLWVREFGQGAVWAAGRRGEAAEGGTFEPLCAGMAVKEDRQAVVRGTRVGRWGRVAVAAGELLHVWQASCLLAASVSL